MTQQQVDPSALLDALQERPDLDFVREMVRFLYQALIDSEATERIGAEPHERSIMRTTRRNGTRAKTISTKTGDVELKIPKLRNGSYFPSFMERRRRIDQALHAVVMEAYVHGVSTSKVDDLVQALGADAGMSKSEVSRICKGLDVELEAFRTRTLGHASFPLRLLGRHRHQRPCRWPGRLPSRRDHHRGHLRRNQRGPRHPGRGLRG